MARFLDLKSAFERASSRGDTSACFEALDAIEEDLGFSFDGRYAA